eukprot:scaffold12989_cov157-Skeletonema_menzelii.AAC.10
MKFSSAAIILLSAAHSANALVSGPRPHSINGRPSLQSSKLFSSAAASSHLSVGNSVGLGIKNVGDNVATSSTSVASAAGESYNINYGPAITLGKLKINIFGAIFGLWEVAWGIIFWYPMLMLYALSRKISSMLPGDILGKKIDPFRRIPINIGYIWGLISFTLFRMWPKVEGLENLEALREVDENGKKKGLKPAMYVANHASWMDIPYVCRVLGFRNYKFIAKAELKKVPILGRAIMVAGHVALDRTNRRSQMVAYKAGVQYMKDGVNLVTFPEGTRSKTGRMGSFKKGAFKMAQTVGAPIVPISIHYADKVQPLDYAFPAKPSRWSRPEGVVKVGKPISTEGKSDDELLEEVWSTIADALPESHKPAKDTPVGAN